MGQGARQIDAASDRSMKGLESKVCHVPALVEEAHRVVAPMRGPEAVKKSRTKEHKEYEEHSEHQTSSGEWNDFEERRKSLNTSPVSGVPGVPCVPRIPCVLDFFTASITGDHR